MDTRIETDDRTPANGARSRRLFIGGLGLGQICSWGSLYYSFPLIAEAMERDLGYSKPEIYGAATLGLVLSGLAAYPIGAAIDRGHGRKIMAAGSFLAGLLLLAWSQVDGLAVFYVLFAGIGLLQAATLYDAAFAATARRFGAANARHAITMLTLWGGFASTVFVPLVQLLLDQLGWRGALAVLGGVNLALCAGLYFAVIDPAADLGPGSAPAGASVLAGQRTPVAHALRSPVFWALALAFTAYAATFSAITFHLYPLLLERGFDTGTVVAGIAVIGPAQVAGRVAIWILAPRASVRRIGSVTVAALPLSLLALDLIQPGFAAIAAVAVLYGAANGIMTIVRGLAVPEMLTREAYGAINGALSAPATFAKALAPASAAMLWATAGSYDTVLLAAIVGALATAIGFWVAAAWSRSGRSC